MVAGESHSTPKVSVIIPAYRCEKTIAEALDSVIAQTFADYEIIVINDGCPNTILLEEALRPYTGKFRYLQQQNQGPSGARNHGIREALGKFVAFLDSDDAWYPDHLAQQLQMFEQDPSLSLVYADYLITRNGKSLGRAFSSEPQHPPVTFEKLLATECVVATSATVALRQALIDAGLFDPQIRCCEDFDLWLRMAFAGNKIAYDIKVHLLHRLSPGSASADPYELKLARVKVYQKTRSTLPLSPRQIALIDQKIAMNQAECDINLTKTFLAEGKFEHALEAAERAKRNNSSWKLRLAIGGLRMMPNAVRYSHRMYVAIAGKWKASKI